MFTEAFIWGNKTGREDNAVALQKGTDWMVTITCFNCDVPIPIASMVNASIPLLLVLQPQTLYKDPRGPLSQATNFRNWFRGKPQELPIFGMMAVHFLRKEKTSTFMYYLPIYSSMLTNVPGPRQCKGDGSAVHSLH